MSTPTLADLLDAAAATAVAIQQIAEEGTGLTHIPDLIHRVETSRHHDAPVRVTIELPDATAEDVDELARRLRALAKTEGWVIEGLLPYTLAFREIRLFMSRVDTP